MKCPACGKDNPSGRTFCAECGGVIPRVDRFDSYRGSTKVYIRGSGGVKSDFMFTVGKDEKHTVAVEYNTKGSEFRVYIDNADKPIPLKKINPKTVTVEIGKDERHKVILAISGFWEQRLQATCDGVVVYRSPHM